jgi:hypothetical protein
MPDAKQPTPEEAEKMQHVAVAGATAAAAGEDAGPPMRAERDRQQLPMSDEDIDKIASALNDKNIQSLRELGAFDPPPEAVQPPEHHAPPAPGEQPPAPGEQPPPAPEKRTWAHKFMGV